MSFLAIDIGNTRLKWAQYASPQPGAALLAHGAVFLEAMDELADKDWSRLEPPTSMLGCVVAGEGVKRRARLGRSVLRPLQAGVADVDGEEAHG